MTRRIAPYQTLGKGLAAMVQDRQASSMTMETPAACKHLLDFANQSLKPGINPGLQVLPDRGCRREDVSLHLLDKDEKVCTTS
mmetsp:Transcript_157681/g.278319  ORF Transcript_157681/g.278319 Transcript_157681/m.278319 type:complete len:83 (+) Transcript_157681:264-512(+)